MARIRYLKPDFFSDEDIGQLPFEVRLLYQGLWVHADKEGRLQDRPVSLKAKIFPYDEVDIEAGLRRLEQPKKYSLQPFIHRYTSDGFSYIQIISWKNHQKPHHTEKDSEIPPPPEFPLFQNPSNLKKKIKGMGNQLKASTELKNGSTPVKERLNVFSLPPDKKKWDDIAFTLGLSQQEADLSYDNFGANNWKRSNKIKLESWDQVRHALKYWRNNKDKFTGPKKPAGKSLSDMKCWCGKKATSQFGNQAFCSSEHRKEKLGW